MKRKLLAATLALLAGCGAERVIGVQGAPATVPLVTYAPVAPIVAVAGASSPALRLEPPETTTPTTVPFDPVGYVNSLPYEWLNAEPAREAYRVVAASLGWSPDQIARWEPFLVDDVMAGESGWCWNLMGRGVVQQYVGCVITYPNGMATDAGFFQLISVYWYGPNGYLCSQHGICGREAVIGSPWQSMRAGLLAVMYDGKGPWCYNASARQYHPKCSTVPRHWS